MEKEEMYEYWFACIKKVSSRTKRHLRERFLSARELYYIEETALKQCVKREGEARTIVDSRAVWNLEEEYEKLKETGIIFLPYFHPDYPKELECLSDAPYAMYLKGNPFPKDTIKVAIVGARSCSPYGEHMAITFAEALAERGVDIISGLARGVDGAAQRGALNANGRSYGVLGCGADVCYPKEHLGLYMDLQERGGLLSEYPPGTKPLPHHFPARNRLISALADVILVMEARERSGSLITADQGLEQGKDVYALPGPVNSSLSKGCNLLIKQGAGLLLSPEELMEELQIFGAECVKKKLKNKIMLETKENMVYSRLGLYPKNVSQIAIETGLEISDLMNQLMSLLLKGYIEEISRNYYVRTS